MSEKSWDDIELHEWVHVHPTQEPDGVFCVRVAQEGDALEFCVMQGVPFAPSKVEQRDACLGGSEFSALVLEETPRKVKVVIAPSEGTGIHWMPRWMFNVLATSDLPWPKQMPFRVVH